jgi:hypothetical protein
MEAKELKLGGRYVRRDGTVTPPLETSLHWRGGLTDPETGADYDPKSDEGHFYYEGDTHELDLVAVYVEHASEAA